MGATVVCFHRLSEQAKLALYSYLGFAGSGFFFGATGCY
jgi:hypothetical protein